MSDADREAFLAACGMTGPLVLGVQRSGAPGVSWRLFDQPFALVGRDPRADLALDGPALSRRHAYFQVVAGRVFCVDLHSRTGTHWTNESGPWGWVSATTPVRIGTDLIRSKLGEPRSPAGGDVSTSLALPVSRSFQRSELPDLSLRVSGGDLQPLTWRASRTMVLIGRSSACKIHLPGASVARVHASLVRTPLGLYVVDLLGPGGVLRNGQPVRWSRVALDDELVVGDYKIEVVALGANSSSLAPGLVLEREDLQAEGEWPRLAAEPAAPPRESVLDRGATDQDSSAEFQAGVLAALQALVALQQEQTTLLRAELAEVRRLASEQRDSQTESGLPRELARSPRILRAVAGESRVLPNLAPAPPRPLPRPPRVRPPLAIQGDAPPQPAEPPPSLVPSAEGSFHAQVFDRLTRIRGEHQGYWQRLRQTVLGKDV